jgi:hypothetical protein
MTNEVIGKKEPSTLDSPEFRKLIATGNKEAIDKLEAYVSKQDKSYGLTPMDCEAAMQFAQVMERKAAMDKLEKELEPQGIKFWSAWDDAASWAPEENLWAHAGVVYHDGWEIYISDLGTTAAGFPTAALAQETLARILKMQGLPAKGNA